jgi:hypothetical protein
LLSSESGWAPERKEQIAIARCAQRSPKKENDKQGAVMTESERVAIAARLHVALRRKTGRVTDTEWMATHVDYAAEMVRLARAHAAETQDEELAAIAARLEEMMAPIAAEALVRAATQQSVDAGTATRPQRTLARYIGGLR